MGLAGRFSATAERHRHRTQRDPVSANEDVSVADRRPVLPHLTHLRRPLGDGPRALTTLTVAVVALIGCGSALAASTARPPVPSSGFTMRTSPRSLTGTNEQHLTLRLTARASAAAQGSAWRACPYPGVPATLQCATLTVPLDYTHAARGSTHIVIDRLPAADPAHRLGSLVVDPGGPGGSGTQLVAHEALGTPGFSSGVRDDYDLIGFDPRGVGLSDPIHCSAGLL